MASISLSVSNPWLLLSIWVPRGVLVNYLNSTSHHSLCLQPVFISLPLMTGLLYGSRAKRGEIHLLSLTWLLYVLLPKELESRKRNSACCCWVRCPLFGPAKPHNTHFGIGSCFDDLWSKPLSEFLQEAWLLGHWLILHRVEQWETLTWGHSAMHRTLTEPGWIAVLTCKRAHLIFNRLNTKYWGLNTGLNQP